MLMRQVFQFSGGDEDLARCLFDAADFATYFSTNPSFKSTPHVPHLVYTSAATWQRDLPLVQVWRTHFSHIGPAIILKEDSVNLSSVSPLTR